MKAAATQGVLMGRSGSSRSRPETATRTAATNSTANERRSSRRSGIGVVTDRVGGGDTKRGAEGPRIEKVAGPVGSGNTSEQPVVAPAACSDFDGQNVQATTPGTVAWSPPLGAAAPW